MPAFGPWELIVILLIVVVIFGAGRLSEVGGAVGKSIKEFRRATTDESHPAASPPTGAAPTAVVSPPAAAPLSAGPAAAPLTAGPAAPPAPVVVENKCPSCGTDNPASQAFCGQCGTRLTRAA